MEKLKYILNNITESIGEFAPNLIAAIAILVIGWIIASVISKAVKMLLNKTSLDNKLASTFDSQSVNLENTISTSIFWFLMLFVLIAFFQTLKLTLITEPLSNFLDTILSYLPQLFGALILFVIAWLLATILRKIIVNVLTRLDVDNRVSERADSNEIPISKSLGDIAYWLVFLIFLPAILSALNLGGLLEPIQVMLNKVLAFLPNILTAVLIIVVGWFVAKIVRQIITNLLTAVGLNSFGEKIGLTKVLGNQSLASLIGLVAYILILLPIIIAGLNALQLEAITTPASNMLNKFLDIIPNIFAAAIILFISFIIAKLLSGFVSNLLEGIGFNKLFAKIGLQKVSDSTTSPSTIIGYLLLVAMMLFAFIEAFNTLGFTTLSEIVTQITELGGHILFGLVILGIGLYFANLASDTIKNSSLSNSNTIALFARVAITLFAGAMALRHMGIANEIINLAFGLLLGAIAVAVAISFGIGGRELAAKKLNEWNNSISN